MNLVYLLNTHLNHIPGPPKQSEMTKGGESGVCCVVFLQEQRVKENMSTFRGLKEKKRVVGEKEGGEMRITRGKG